MASAYQINIQMSQETVQQLMQNGFTLYGLHAAAAPVGGALPTIWFSTTGFGTNTVLSWSEQQYQAYTSQGQVMPGAQIRMNARFPIDLGEQMVIYDPSGQGQVQQGGQPGAIGIRNNTTVSFVCGLALGVSDEPVSPIHAMPLYGNMMNMIVPLAKVFLMFAGQSMNRGTAVAQAFGPGALVDLTGSPSQTVSFDINTGWAAGPGVQTYPPSTDLSSLLLPSPY